VEISERNLHLRLQEMCDCYLETDYKKQLHVVAGMSEGDVEENALKYLGLAIMYAVTERAQKLSFKRKDDKIKVSLKIEQKTALTSPNPALFEAVINIMRSVLHIEGDHGKSELAMGLRSGDLSMKVKIDRKPGKESMKIKFM